MSTPPFLYGINRDPVDGLGVKRCVICTKSHVQLIYCAYEFILCGRSGLAHASKLYRFFFQFVAPGRNEVYYSQQGMRGKMHLHTARSKQLRSRGTDSCRTNITRGKLVVDGRIFTHSIPWCLLPKVPEAPQWDTYETHSGRPNPQPSATGHLITALGARPD